MSDLLVKHELSKHRNKVARIRHRQTMAQKQAHHEQSLRASEAQNRRQVGIQKEIQRDLEVNNQQINKLQTEVSNFNNIAAYNRVYTESREFRLNSVFSLIRAITDCLIDHVSFPHRSYIGSTLNQFEVNAAQYPVRFTQLRAVIGSDKWVLLAREYGKLSHFPKEEPGLFQYFITLYFAYLFHRNPSESNLSRISSLCLRFVHMEHIEEREVLIIAKWFVDNEDYLGDKVGECETNLMAYIHQSLSQAGYPFPYSEFDMTIKNPTYFREELTEKRLKGWSDNNVMEIESALDRLIGG
ncbi:hypothetical protein ACNO5E_24490 [Vibrio parahaemolyticus]